ncbi:MAG: ubiquinol-cytochrome c reductase iron-sulfur subunit [Haloferacaceae archaeon]
MSADDSDKYPEDSGRRRFVKGVVGGATLAGVSSVGAAAINSATRSPGAGGGPTQSWAIENTGGPAPRGMPMIPIEIDGDGFIKGVWPEVQEVNQGGITVEIARSEDFKGSGHTYSQEWFQYCGIESYQGLQPSLDSDNYFRVGSNPGYEWQSQTYEEGDRLNIDDFSDYESWNNGIGNPGVGKPATGKWRSQDAEKVIPVQVLRSPMIERLANGAGDIPDAARSWLQAASSRGAIAWLNKCTHFCCVPGWKQSQDAVKFGEADDVYCQCHQSLYDPFSIVQTLFIARPRPQG